jgi:hypothetical protein
VIDAFTHHRLDKHNKGEYEKRKDIVDAVRITFATMQEHPHRLKVDNKAPEIPEKSVVDNLRDVWLNNR